MSPRDCAWRAERPAAPRVSSPSSTSSSPVPFLGGTLFTNPANLILPLATDGLGRFDLTFSWPALAPGSSLYLQAAVLDASSPFGVSVSNALVGVTR